jgi:hypothetical protein
MGRGTDMVCNAETNRTVFYRYDERRRCFVYIASDFILKNNMIAAF